MKKPEILMNKPVYLVLSILQSNKILKYEFWYEYVKQKYCEKRKLCYMDAAIFMVYRKTGDIYEHIAEDIEIRFDT